MKGYQNVKGSNIVLASRGTYRLAGDKYKRVLLMTKYTDATEFEILNALSSAADNVMFGHDDEFGALEKCIVEFQPEVWDELANDPVELLERLDISIDVGDAEVLMMKLGVVSPDILRYARQHYNDSFLYKELFMGGQPPGQEICGVKVYLQENMLPLPDMVNMLLACGVRKSDVLDISGDYYFAEDLVDNFYEFEDINNVGDSSDYFLLEDCAKVLACIDERLVVDDGSEDPVDRDEVAVN
ncbi:MAG: hypothetical protein U9R08_05185 [Nanoarchaeota archaeon]|nr:hypothetical protein [Nanoarchaeota archaeon]